jgi:hypothetical protein
MHFLVQTSTPRFGSVRQGNTMVSMAHVRVEGILGHILVAVEWRDGEVSGSPVLLTGIHQEAERAGGRFYDDPLAFAAVASGVVERYSDAPARVTSEGIDGPLRVGMAGVTGGRAVA